MSAIGDAFAALRLVLSLDDRVKGLRTDVDAMKADLNTTRDRVSRLEGMFEMALYRETRRLDRE